MRLSSGMLPIKYHSTYVINFENSWKLSQPRFLYSMVHKNSYQLNSKREKFAVPKEINKMTQFIFLVPSWVSGCDIMETDVKIHTFMFIYQ